MRARIESVVTLVLAAVSACGGTTSDPETAPLARDGGTDVPAPKKGTNTIAPFPDDATFACSAPLSPLAPGLRPSVPVDYLEVRSSSPAGEPDDADAGLPEARYESRTGVACATATRREECLTKLRSTRSQGWAEGSCGPPSGETHYLVYTRGDEVGTAVDAAGVVAMLAPIDSEEEARLVLLASYGIALQCTESPGRSGIRKNADGSYEVVAVYGGCPTARSRFRIETSGAISTVASQDDGQSCSCGRRFEGLDEGPSGGASIGLGAYFAELAYLEAASVTAFRRFASELGDLGAPRAFVERAHAARRDEIRHAAVMAQLARRFGGRPGAVSALPARRRTAYEIALENAVEGCVRETYGALVAAYQARTAADDEIRAVMTEVARDEAEHAALAHDVAAWLEPRLLPAERRAIADAKARAIDGLYATLAPAEGGVRRDAGHPDVEVASRLVAALVDLDVEIAA